MLLLFFCKIHLLDFEPDFLIIGFMCEELRLKKGAIFDLDGTLLDSMGVWNQIDLDFFAKRNMTLPPDYQGVITAMQPYQAAVYTIDRFGFKESPDAILEEWMDMAYAEYHEKLPLKPFVREYVRQLKEEDVHMCVASSSDKKLVEAALERTGIIGYMDRILTSTEIGCAKGTPDIYLACAETMHLPPDKCAVYEDIIQGIRGANAGGFYTVGVYEASYRKDPERFRAVQAEADLYIHSFSELLTENAAAD